MPYTFSPGPLSAAASAFLSRMARDVDRANRLTGLYSPVAVNSCFVTTSPNVCAHPSNEWTPRSFSSPG